MSFLHTKIVYKILNLSTNSESSYILNAEVEHLIHNFLKIFGYILYWQGSLTLIDTSAEMTISTMLLIGNIPHTVHFWNIVSILLNFFCNISTLPSTLDLGTLFLDPSSHIPLLFTTRKCSTIHFPLWCALSS